MVLLYMCLEESTFGNDGLIYILSPIALSWVIVVGRSSYSDRAGCWQMPLSLSALATAGLESLLVSAGDRPPAVSEVAARLAGTVRDLRSRFASAPTSPLDIAVSCSGLRRPERSLGR